MLGLKARTITPIEVPERYHEYIEGLEADLTHARAVVSDKEEYLRQADRLGVKLDSVRDLADQAAREGRRVHDGNKTLQRIRRLLAAGCEPTQPNAQWYCGAITTPRLVKDRWGEKRYPRESWPSRNHQYGDNVATFKSAIPVSALAAYARVQQDLDGVRIYSPSQEDFQANVNPRPKDPVMLGYIKYLDKDLFFEIARWDIDDDLAKLFTAR